ncbi:MAG: glycosyltransferase family 1 protein [Flavobacterium sp.]|nr:MAG: glycosyltransferase family 1 protein [Flavobacterium sp.]
MKYKLMRITTVPISLLVLLKKQLLFMADHFDVLAISSGGDALSELAMEKSLNVKQVDMTRKITPISDIYAIFKLFRIMRSELPMIVHTHTPKAGLLGMIAAWLAGVPIRLHTVAGLPLLEKKGFLKWALERTEILTSLFATQVYCNSKNLMALMIKEGYCNRNKLKVLGEGSTVGIDTSFFNPETLGNSNQRRNLRASLRIEEDNFVYCFIGRMVGDKGVNELVQSFVNLYETNSSLILLLVGPFEEELDPLQDKIKLLIHSHAGIRWLDFKKDVRSYLWISDLFVFPSYREGFPNVLMQAGAMGLMSIASDINGCNEIIQHNVNGLIVPVKDIPALEFAMRLVYSKPDLRRAMASVSRKMITDRYESKLMASLLFEDYEKKIKKHGQVNTEVKYV